MKELVKELSAAAFWTLPYNIRRSIFPILRPKTYKTYQLWIGPDNQGQKSLRDFERHKCIFIHIPKTAGKSISYSLFNQWVGHLDILKFQLIFPKPQFDSYYKFAFVRNPYDRLVSAFYFVKGKEWEEGHNWAEANLSRYSDFESFVKGWVTKKNVLTRKPFEPQHRFICDTHGNILVDFVGRFERLEQDFALVADKLQIKVELQHRNPSKHRLGDYRDYYTAETKRIVAEVYERDFNVLGYEMT